MMSNNYIIPKNGEFVFSLAGHDKGRCYVVLAVLDGIALLADGKCRKICNAKSKSFKHLSTTSVLDADLKALIDAKESINDKKIRKAIYKFKLKPMDE